MAIDFDATPTQPVICQHQPLLEWLWAGHFILDSHHHSARQSWVDAVLAKMPEDVLQAKALCEQGNFPLINLFGMVQDLLPSVPFLEDFISIVASMPVFDFQLAYFDGEVSAAQLKAVLANPERFDEFYQVLPWAETGSPDYIHCLLYQPEQFRDAQLALVSFVQPFAGEVVTAEADKIEQALAFVRQQLKHKAPMALAQEIKGSHFKDQPYQHFLFCPCLFADTHNVFLLGKESFAVLYNCEQSAFHINSQAEPLAEAFKIIADPKRIEILRMVRQRPTFAKVLAARLGLTTATMSRHIELLKKADLIREQKVDRVKYIHINEERFRRLQGQLTAHVFGVD